MAKVKKQDNYEVTVRYGDDWCEITSPSGQKRQVNVWNLPSAWDGMSFDERKLFDKLLSVESGESVTITHEQMKLFAALATRSEGAGEDSKVPNPAPAPEVNGIKPPPDPRKEHKKDRVASESHSGYVLFFYDIPQQHNGMNPSDIMWQYGYRLNLSNWVVPVGQIVRMQSTVLREFQDHNDAIVLQPGQRLETHPDYIDYHIVEFSEAERQKILVLAKERIAAEIVRIHTALIRTVIAADNQLKEALAATEGSRPLSAKERERKQSYRDSRVRACIKKSREGLENALQSCALYDQMEEMSDLVQGLKQAIAAEDQALQALVASRH